MVAGSVAYEETEGANQRMSESKQKYAAKGKDSRTKRRERRRQERAAKNGDEAAMREDRPSVYDNALVLCVSCGAKCYKVLGFGRRFQCPKCKEIRNMPDLEFSDQHFVALYRGGNMYAWRADASGNFPALHYGGIEHMKRRTNRPVAFYDGDIDTQHEPHFVAGVAHSREIIDELSDNMGDEQQGAFGAGLPVWMFFLKFKGVNC